MDGGGRRELAIDEAETAETRIRRLESENPVVIFTRTSSSSCCMCDVIKRLLSSLGAHPTVIQLSDDEELATAADGVSGGSPVVFIGGTSVGGLESLVALHLSGRLVPKLAEAGAVSDMRL